MVKFVVFWYPARKCSYYKDADRPRGGGKSCFIFLLQWQLQGTTSASKPSNYWNLVSYLRCSKFKQFGRLLPRVFCFYEENEMPWDFTGCDRGSRCVWSSHTQELLWVPLMKMCKDLATWNKHHISSLIICEYLFHTQHCYFSFTAQFLLFTPLCGNSNWILLLFVFLEKSTLVPWIITVITHSTVAPNTGHALDNLNSASLQTASCVCGGSGGVSREDIAGWSHTGNQDAFQGWTKTPLKKKKQTSKTNKCHLDLNCTLHEGKKNKIDSLSAKAAQEPLEATLWLHDSF